LTVLRYIEANPLRAKIVKQAEEYPHSSSRCTGWVNPMPANHLRGVAGLAKIRQRWWAGNVHLPLKQKVIDFGPLS